MTERLRSPLQRDTEPTIAELIKRPLISCAPSASLLTATQLMHEQHVSCILLQAEQRIVGIWSAADARKLDYNTVQPANLRMQDLMSAPVISANCLTLLHGAASLMLNHHIRHLLVVDHHNKPQGIITHSDIIRQQQLAFYLRFRTAQSGIRHRPLFISANSSLNQAASALLQAQTSALLVRFADGDIGLFSEGDLVAYLAAAQPAQNIGTLAKRNPLTVNAEVSLLDTVTLMTKQQVQHVIVTQQDTLLGILSYKDILHNIEHTHIEQLKAALKERELALRTSTDYLRLAHKVIAASMDGIMITDQHGFIQSVNPSFTTLTGYSEAEAIGQTPRLLSSGLHSADFYRDMWQILLENGHWQGEVWNRRKKGDIYPQWLSITAIRSEDQQISHYAAIFSDMTERKRQQDKIYQLAYMDELTGLANRRLFSDRLKQALASAQRHKHAIAVLFLDLDLFKRINDTLGHQAGDQALQEVAKRLQATIREGESVARIGGDEFMILVPEVNGCHSVQALAQRVIQQLSRPVALLGQDFFLTTSIGISLYPKDGNSAEQLLKHADMAMYQAKNAGRNQYSFYQASTGQQNDSELRLEQALRQALRLQLLDVYYQPKFDIRHQQLVGLEALVRWYDPELGQLSPALFIPLAEKLGLIHQLGDQVLQQVCAQLQRWQQYQIPIAVNLSALQLVEPDFLARLRSMLQQTAVRPQLLELELTESCLIPEQAEHTLRVLTALKRLGLRLSIDDFGTGYSSLSYLRRLPLDAIKIDKSFIRELPENASDRQITLAIIAMAKALGLEVIAEGIEHEAQRQFLLSAGCDTGQGFIMAPALPARDIELRLQALTQNTLSPVS